MPLIGTPIIYLPQATLTAFYTFILYAVIAKYMQGLNTSLSFIQTHGNINSDTINEKKRKFDYLILYRAWLFPWYFNKMVLQNTLRSDVSAILKSIHVRKMIDR